MSEPEATIDEEHAPRRYLVKTNAGDVIVVVNPHASGLADDLFSFEKVTPAGLEHVDMTTPLSAFSSKVVDLIELHGTADFGGSAVLKELLIKEKATFELRRIERFAKEHAAD